MYYWYCAYRALRGKTQLPYLGHYLGLFWAEELCVPHIDFTAGKVIYQNYSRMLDTMCINNEAVQPSFNSVDLLSLPLRLHVHTLIYRQVSLSDLSCVLPTCPLTHMGLLQPVCNKELKCREEQDDWKMSETDAIQHLQCANNPHRKLWQDRAVK